MSASVPGDPAGVMAVQYNRHAFRPCFRLKGVLFVEGIEDMKP